jgi:hypothetical protein
MTHEQASATVAALDGVAWPSDSVVRSVREGRHLDCLTKARSSDLVCDPGDFQPTSGSSESLGEQGQAESQGSQGASSSQE